MARRGDIIIGIDAGTSVIKAVAFGLSGEQLGVCAVRNSYTSGADGSATQSLRKTWLDCAQAIRGLGDDVHDLGGRVAALGVTGQGDGTWLVGAGNVPVADAWLWLDARATPTVSSLLGRPEDAARFAATGTGLNTCQQGSQLAHMAKHAPDMLSDAEVALHCKDWLYLNLTGVRATDPSEASFTFGDFRTRHYSDTVLEALELTAHRGLLPEILDGSQTTHPLTDDAAAATGLRPGTPVALGYVDMVMTALGAGVHTGEEGVACSTIGSTGVHLRGVAAEDVCLNADRTGYVICLPIPGRVTQVQTNMAATLNIDWALDLVADLLGEFGATPDRADIVGRIDGWLDESAQRGLVYHPYISDAGERGPFLDGLAQASLLGLRTTHRFPDIMRAVVDGLAMAARDCFAAMGPLPEELRVTGGAARSAAVRRVLAAALNTRIRMSLRDETGAAGAAMMAAVGIGAYPDMDACIDDWVRPYLGEVETPDPALIALYDSLFMAYHQSRLAVSTLWPTLAEHQAKHARHTV
ncbi:MAG: FGGY-family carbohydrate kinase [Pseudomonadota bacterium]